MRRAVFSGAGTGAERIAGGAGRNTGGRETGTPKAKVCETKGDRTAASVASVWNITVSSSGGSCGHTRIPVGRTNNVTFGVSPAPSHGQITQKPAGPNTIVVYTPAPGYKGADSFTLVTPGGQALHLPYTVNVVP